MRTRSRTVWGLLALGLCLGIFASAAPRAVAQGKTAPDAKEVRAVAAKGIEFLKSSQAKDGSFSGKRFGPGVTALVVAALLHNGVSPEEPVVAKALKNIEDYQKPNGGIYAKGLANYTTSVAIMALQPANTKGKYDKVLKRAADFLKGIQQEGEAAKASYGGFGYDAKSRPDASNTNFTVEALLAAGVPKDDPAIQKALQFISRCQNLPGETNKLPFAKKATKDDLGGIVYTPLAEEDSKHRTSEGGLRSVGAMTYGGLKSFLYAGVKKDDPRVIAALGWIRRHWSLDENPGQGKAGLYYYYNTFAKALDTLGEPTITDAKGTKHAWRVELFDALKSRQRPNGSWANMGDRVFGEGDPNLATAFALLSLSYCNEKK